MIRVSVFGLGYVGCVSAACLADYGYEVIGVDVNPDKVDMINSAMPPVVEPGLGRLLEKVVAPGRLKATTSSERAVGESDVALICVGTPGHANGRLDVATLEQVAREIGSAVKKLNKDFTVVVRSTGLPGTVEGVVTPALLEGAGGRFDSEVLVAVNPEFIREGSALDDFAQPPLTLVGCPDNEAVYHLRALYAGVDAPFVRTDIRTAEMVKYACNAYHALKVCFANEIGDVCDALGADAQEVMRIFSLDRKLNISSAYLRPGFAFGGSCLPKDLRALLYAAKDADVSAPMLASLLPSNEGQIRQAVNRVLASGKRRIGVVGLSFKPGTDDLRESPLVTLVETLIGKGCDVRILDRNVSIARLTGANQRYIEEEIPHIAELMCETPAALIEHAEVIVIGGASDEAAGVLEDVNPDQRVVDLTRGTVEKKYRAAEAA